MTSAPEFLETGIYALQFQRKHWHKKTNYVENNERPLKTQNQMVFILATIGKRRKSQDIRILGNFKKIPGMTGIEGRYPTDHPKSKF